MPQDFNQQWADLRVSITKIEESTKYQNAALEEIRETQQRRVEIQESFDKRLTALESSAWTWGGVFASLPRLAAFATLTGLIGGLILWLLKHLHL